MLLHGGVKKDKEFVYLMWRGQEKVELVPLGWEAVGGKGEHLDGEQWEAKVSTWVGSRG